MRCDKSFDVPPAVIPDTVGWWSGHDTLEDVKQLRGDLQIVLVAGLMKSDQDLVG